MEPRHMSSKSTRRQFIRDSGIVTGLAAVSLACGARAQTKRQVTVRLDWIYQGPNAGFMVAQEKGFYEQAGLNVEIGPGKGSGSTAQLVASKATQFGFADGYVVGIADNITIGEAELRRLAGNELGGASGSLAGADLDVETGLFVKAFLLCHHEAGIRPLVDPIETYGNLPLGLRARSARERHRGETRDDAAVTYELT